MARSSLDYSEQHGLMIALRNLEATLDKERSEYYALGDWMIITDWLKKRIKTLDNK